MNNYIYIYTLYAYAHIHAFIHYRGGQQAALARGTTRRLRGTGVNAQGRIEGPSSEDDDADEETDEEEARGRLGFDRLRSVSECSI